MLFTKLLDTVQWESVCYWNCTPITKWRKLTILTARKYHLILTHQISEKSLPKNQTNHVITHYFHDKVLPAKRYRSLWRQEAHLFQVSNITKYMIVLIRVTWGTVLTQVTWLTCRPSFFDRRQRSCSMAEFLKWQRLQV